MQHARKEEHNAAVTVPKELFQISARQDRNGAALRERGENQKHDARKSLGPNFENLGTMGDQKPRRR
jgi:hypothetical protein